MPFNHMHDCLGILCILPFAHHSDRLRDALYRSWIALHADELSLHVQVGRKMNASLFEINFTTIIPLFYLI